MDNFYKTALRTNISSKILHEEKHFFNSCYLAGYVVECYSKILIQHVYSTTISDLKDQFRHDLKKTAKEIEYLISDPTISGLIDSKYLVDLKTTCATIVVGSGRWDPSKRYYNDETIWNEDVSKKYQSEIQIIMQYISLLKLDGVI